MMIKRSSILLLLLLSGSITYLVYAAGNDAKITAEPIKCSEKCPDAKAPVQWNMVSPSILYPET